MQPEIGEISAGSLQNSDQDGQNSSNSKPLVPFDCPQCPKSFTLKGNLKKHIQSVHTGEKTFECQICGKSFSQKVSLKRHMVSLHPSNLELTSQEKFVETKSEDGQKSSFTCTECGKEFTAMRSVKEHIKTVHEGVKNFKCQECGKEFAKSGNLKAHIKQVHKIFEKPEPLISEASPTTYNCQQCDEQFPTAIHLVNHVSTTHKNIDPNNIHNCSFCGLIFPHKEAFEGHLGSCEMMPKLDMPSSPSKMSKKDHAGSKIHESSNESIVDYDYIKTTDDNGKASFTCTSCGKSFTALRSLQEHVKTIHEGLRNYECNYCGKDFTKSGNLKAHISAVHDGEKNYHCSQCSKSFSQLSNYNLHYR